MDCVHVCVCREVPSSDKTILFWHCPCRVTSVCLCEYTFVMALGVQKEVNTTTQNPLWFTDMGVGVAEEWHLVMSVWT